MHVTRLPKTVTEAISHESSCSLGIGHPSAAEYILAIQLECRCIDIWALLSGAGAIQGQSGAQLAAPAGPNTQPLDMFNPQVMVPGIGCTQM